MHIDDGAATEVLVSYPRTIGMFCSDRELNQQFDY